MNQIGAGVVAVVAGVIGLAMVAVIVSQRAQTPQVIQSGGSALSQIIGAAVQPVSGGNNFGAAGQTTGGTSS